MPGLEPGIHAVTSQRMGTPMEWIAGSKPGNDVLGYSAASAISFGS